MFRRRPTAIDNILRGVLRNQGLETPLLQRRVVNAWDGVVRSMSDADMAELVIENTEQKDIRNQTLWVKILSPAIRADLQMKCSDLVAALNGKVGAQVISTIRFY
mgnify:CR=1 FL=1